MGSVHYTLERAGGLVAYLTAVDNNVYSYAHMSATIGGGPRVGAGGAVGRVGQTGTRPRRICTSRSASAASTVSASTRTRRCAPPAADQRVTRPTAISHVCV